MLKVAITNGRLVPLVTLYNRGLTVHVFIPNGHGMGVAVWFMYSDNEHSQLKDHSSERNKAISHRIRLCF